MDSFESITKEILHQLVYRYFYNNQQADVTDAEYTYYA